MTEIIQAQVTAMGGCMNDRIAELQAAITLATQRAEAADAERDDEVEWLREMLADYRISYDDHTHGRRLALNLFIHELRRECEALRVLETEFGCWFMYPPDGGDVSCGEQVKRMSDELLNVRAERDALRKDAAVLAVLRDAPDEVTNAMSEHIYSYAVTTRQDMRFALRAALDAALAVQPTTGESK